MEINVNKEICSYKEAVFFGLTTRQFVCSVGGNRHCCWHIFWLKRHFGKRNGELALYDCRTSCGGNGIFQV